jgi:hypothetical protein
MSCILIHNDKIRGVFTSKTRSLQAAHDLQDAYGNVDWEEQELTGSEIFFTIRRNQRIRVIEIESDKLLSLGETL